MAMSCYYLEGIAPAQVELMQIFEGALLPSMVFVAMFILSMCTGIALWLPNQIYA